MIVIEKKNSFLVSSTREGSGGSKGEREGRPPPRGSNSFNFMQFLGNFRKILCWRPPGELDPPLEGLSFRRVSIFLQYSGTGEGLV